MIVTACCTDITQLMFVS